MYAWSWVRGSAELGRRGGLWVSSGRTEERRAEADLVAAVSSVAAQVPDMMETGELGPRLAEYGEFTGMAAVDFVTRVMPALAETRRGGDRRVRQPARIPGGRRGPGRVAGRQPDRPNGATGST